MIVLMIIKRLFLYKKKDSFLFNLSFNLHEISFVEEVNI